MKKVILTLSVLGLLASCSPSTTEAPKSVDTVAVAPKDTAAIKAVVDTAKVKVDTTKKVVTVKSK